MMSFYKRFNHVCVATLLIAFMLLSGCSDIPDKAKTPYFENGLVVTFVDVGHGDCTFIRLPDGKNMLIDVGVQSEGVYANVQAVLKAYSVDTIDYLVLTHPDSDHIGNGQAVVEDYNIKRAFLPDLKSKELYANFHAIKDSLLQAGAVVNFSKPFLKIEGSDYFIGFLSPVGSLRIDGYYGDFNITLNPTASQENNLSPIIYLEYRGVRFLFTGDADSSQEALVLRHYNLDEYKWAMPDVDLSNVDVLKVAHHGSSDSSSEDFLRLLSPKIAVISVGGNNAYALPSTETINRLRSVCADCDILRTDIHGNVTVHVTDYGKYNVYNN